VFALYYLLSNKKPAKKAGFAIRSPKIVPWQQVGIYNSPGESDQMQSVVQRFPARLNEHYHRTKIMEIRSSDKCPVGVYFWINSPKQVKICLRGLKSGIVKAPHGKEPQ